MLPSTKYATYPGGRPTLGRRIVIGAEMTAHRDSRGTYG